MAGEALAGFAGVQRREVRAEEGAAWSGSLCSWVGGVLLDSEVNSENWGKNGIYSS